jgi:hypothetical protein
MSLSDFNAPLCMAKYHKFLRKSDSVIQNGLEHVKEKGKEQVCKITGIKRQTKISVLQPVSQSFALLLVLYF